MLTKILLGSSASLAVALLIIFNMLMDSREALGTERAAVQEAANINKTMTAALAASQANLADYRTQLDNEREAREQAQRDKEAAAAELVAATTDARRRLRNAEHELEGQALLCANALVPQSFIDSLHVEPDHIQ